MRDFREVWALQDAMVDRLMERFSPLIADRRSLTFPLGWEKLIEEVFEQFAVDKNSSNPLQVLQIKDKFGGLRIYTNFSSEKIRGIIAEAEGRAESICMDCGKESDEVTNQPKYRVLCRRCTENFKREEPEAFDDAEELYDESE